MPDPFLIAFRESFQCSLLLALVLFYPPVRENRKHVLGLIAGVLAAFLAGFTLGCLPALGKDLLSHETWTFWRYVAESIIFYSSVVLINRKPSPQPGMIALGLFI